MNVSFVLDASAVLAMIREEPGAEVVEAMLADATISAVNWSEVRAKLYDRGAPVATVQAALRDLRIRVVPFDRISAERAGDLRPLTRAAGLSFADRACLACAAASNATAVTADRAWAKLDVGVEVRLIR